MCFTLLRTNRVMRHLRGSACSLGLGSKGTRRSSGTSARLMVEHARRFLLVPLHRLDTRTMCALSRRQGRQAFVGRRMGRPASTRAEARCRCGICSAGEEERRATRAFRARGCCPSQCVRASSRSPRAKTPCVERRPCAAQSRFRRASPHRMFDRGGSRSDGSRIGPGVKTTHSRGSTGTRGSARRSATVSAGGLVAEITESTANRLVARLYARTAALRARAQLGLRNERHVADCTRNSCRLGQFRGGRLRVVAPVNAPFVAADFGFEQRVGQRRAVGPPELASLRRDSFSWIIFAPAPCPIRSVEHEPRDVRLRAVRIIPNTTSIFSSRRSSRGSAGPTATGLAVDVARRSRN